MTRAVVVALVCLVGAVPATARADQVVADDEIVQGGLCIGLDCVNDEAFGTDTLRLKENNTRLAFQDTSAGAGLPGNDWEITANESASGGLSHLGVNDVTGARIPLRVVAGAPASALELLRNGSLRTSAGLLGQPADGTAAAPVDGATVVSALRDVPVTRFRFTATPSGGRHLSPDPAALNAALGVGSGGDLSTSDVAGAALAALQRLAARLDTLAIPAGPAGPEGLRGAAGPAGPSAVGPQGPAATASPSGDTALALARLELRIDRLAASQRALGSRTTKLARRVTSAGRRLR